MGRPAKPLGVSKPMRHKSLVRSHAPTAMRRSQTHTRDPYQRDCRKP
jgi:hypothetical protein